MKLAIALAVVLVGLVPAAAGASSALTAVADPAKEVRIAVMADGTVEVDGREMTVEQLGDRLDRARDEGSSVAYYREGSAAAPSPAAEASMIAVLEGVVSRGLPLRLSSKPDFSDVVDENGQSHSRAMQ